MKRYEWKIQAEQKNKLTTSLFSSSSSSVMGSSVEADGPEITVGGSGRGEQRSGWSSGWDTVGTVDTVGSDSVCDSPSGSSTTSPSSGSSSGLEQEGAI